ncbi:MAG TPA: hypothetical protein VH765_02110 [Xanthobacteraceae bacterium]|jgi:hypothetical protein
MGEGSRAAQYRALADECERLAAEVKLKKQREELLRKAKGYRALADNEDWLDGKKGEDGEKLR